jgi:diguanylate cyclase (GGDEF)-like protein
VGSWRLTVNGRVLLLLAATAALSTGLALGVHDFALARDLGAAAWARLSRPAEATTSLVDAHLGALTERYRAVSGTPQFRANLETEDVPTLLFYASQLALRERAALVAFLDDADHAKAFAGAPDLLERGAGVREPELLFVDGRAFAATSVPLSTDGQHLGRLVAIEPLSEPVLERWAHLVGARVGLEPATRAAPSSLERTVFHSDGWDLRVTASLDAERDALSRSRRTLLLAGAGALGLALAAGFALSRGLVRPIRAIQAATERIGRGDFDVRTPSDRRDEIGDVARAFDVMLGRLRDYRVQVDASLGELRRSRGRLETAQRIAGLGSWELELGTGELRGSAEFHSLLGLEPADKPVALETLRERLHPEDRAAVLEAVRSCIEGDIGLRLDHRIVLPDGTERILSTQGQRVNDDGERPVRLEGTTQDVTERRRSEEQIRYLAYYDGLTGLGNRRLFAERLELAIAQARRGATGVGVLYLDLDQFKRINDTLGHSVGDRVLRGVADRIVASVRESDLIARSLRADSESAISRLGGDEFTILLPEVDDPRDLAKVARRILESLRRPFTVAGQELVVSASIGITAWPEDGDGVDALLRNADAAMYHAKDQGRNNYQFFTAAMNDAALERFSLEGRLRRALERGEFEVHYQPRLAVATGELVALEALVRWRDPDDGLVLPGAFIPMAEELGLIAQLSDFVLREVCQQLARWRRAGRRLVPVSVNLSAHQFRSGDPTRSLDAIRRETGIDPRWLEIEITETALVHDEAAVAAVLRELRRAGMRVALDDFGTEYSSLNYLRRLPVDILKIDRSFVSGIDSDPVSAALTEAIISMARALRLTVVAEGVETEGQWRSLRRWRCDELQGFVFSPARPAREVEACWGGATPPAGA